MDHTIGVLYNESIKLCLLGSQIRRCEHEVRLPPGSHHQCESFLWRFSKQCLVGYDTPVSLAMPAIPDGHSHVAPAPTCHQANFGVCYHTHAGRIGHIKLLESHLRYYVVNRSQFPRRNAIVRLEDGVGVTVYAQFTKMHKREFETTMIFIRMDIDDNAGSLCRHESGRWEHLTSFQLIARFVKMGHVAMGSWPQLRLSCVTEYRSVRDEPMTVILVEPFDEVTADLAAQPVVHVSARGEYASAMLDAVTRARKRAPPVHDNSSLHVPKAPRTSTRLGSVVQRVVIEDRPAKIAKAMKGADDAPPSSPGPTLAAAGAAGPAPPPLPPPLAPPPAEPADRPSIFMRSGWTYLRVGGGYIVFKPGNGVINAHCEHRPHKSILVGDALRSCKCHFNKVARARTRLTESGRVIGMLALWLLHVETHPGTTRSAHHDLKERIATKEYLAERRIARHHVYTLHGGTSAYEQLLKEEADKDGADSEPEVVSRCS